MKTPIALIAFAFMLLAACVPEYVPPPQPVPVEQPPVPQPVLVPERVIPVPAMDVRQTRGKERIQWGYDEEGRLVLLNSSSKIVVLSYDDGRLSRIDDSVKPLTLAYDAGRLVRVQKGVKQWAFTYTSKGALLTMENDERLTVTHDSKGRLSSVTRDGGASTEFEYDKQNRTKAIYRARIKTNLAYDDRGRLKLMSRDDDHLVLAYWRYNLLSSLSGTMYGIKETVNYGPTAVTLVSDVEQNEFIGGNDEARMHAFNTFLFCTRFRKLPVIFDGQSWTIFHEYMKGNISDYLRIEFVCDALP